jgi:hypothetical protein
VLAAAAAMAGCDGTPMDGDSSRLFDGRWIVAKTGSEAPDECLIIFENEVVQWTEFCTLPSEQIVSAEKGTSNGNQRGWVVTIRVPDSASVIKIEYEMQIEPDGTLTGTRTSMLQNVPPPGITTTFQIVMTRM